MGVGASETSEIVSQLLEHVLHMHMSIVDPYPVVFANFHIFHLLIGFPLVD